MAFGLLIWILLAGMGHVRGPFRVMSSAVSGVMSRLTNRRSDADVMSEGPAPSRVMTPAGPQEEGPRSVVLRSPVGPRDLDELRREVGLSGEPPEDEESERAWWEPMDGEERPAWVARMVTANRAPTWIDNSGAALFAVSTRTIARDRADLKGGRYG